MAPRLPTSDDLGPAGSLSSQRGIASYDLSPLARGQAAIAGGIEKIGNAGLGVGLDMLAKEKREGAVFDKARADAAFIPAHTDLLLKQQDEPDADAYRQGAETALREAAGNIRDPQARELWLLNHAGTLASGKATVKGLTDKRDADHELAAIRTDEDRGLHTIVNAPNPADAMAMARAVNTRWDEAAAKGYVSEVQALAAKKAFALRGINARIGLLDPEDQVAAWKGPVTTRDGMIDRIIGVESNGNATARNPNSTATGAGQFTEGTWLDTVRAHRPDLMQGRSPAAVLALRNDPDLSREMVGHLADDNGKALAAQGLPQNPTTLYLSHFLGSGGATAVLKAKPGTPVADVLGDDQIAANRSILAGKTVDSVVRWAGRKMGSTSEGQLVAAIPEDQREVGLRHAEALYDRDQRQAQRAQQEEAQSYKARIADDLASIETTGQGNPNLRAEDVGRLFGPQAQQDFLADRARSSSIHSALDGIGALPEADALQRLQRLQPRPGAEGYRADAEAYGKAAKHVDAMLSLRRSDPARAVEALPAVTGARSAAAYDTAPDGRRTIRPDSAQGIIRARLAAQDQLGIGAPLAVTKREADEIVRQVHAAGDDGKKLQPVLSAMRQTYGPLADRVLADSFQLHGLNQDLADEASRVLGKIGAGTRPNPFDQRNLDRAAGRQQLDDALAGKAGQGAPAGTASRGAALGAGEPPELKGTPEGKDIKALHENQSDPVVRKQFEATYGPGTAQRVIDEANRRLGVTEGKR